MENSIHTLVGPIGDVHRPSNATASHADSYRRHNQGASIPSTAMTQPSPPLLLIPILSLSLSSSPI